MNSPMGLSFLGNPKVMLQHGDRCTRSSFALDFCFLNSSQKKRIPQGPQGYGRWGAHFGFSKKNQTLTSLLRRWRFGKERKEGESRPGWIRLAAAWGSGRCLCPGQGVRTGLSLKSLPTQIVLGFYSKKICKKWNQFLGSKIS